MKLKNIKQKNYKLLKIYLLILEISLKKIENIDTSISVFVNNKLEIRELHFKKALKIIQNYHLTKRKILFISTQVPNQTTLEKVIEKTKHNFIETTNWTPGNFKTCFSFLRYPPGFQKIIQNYSLFLIRKKLSKILINKIDLIVITSPYIDSQILDEINQLNIPIITLNNDSKSDKITTYKTISNFSILNNKQFNFYSFFIHSILKT